PLALAELDRHEPGEQVLEVAEEPRLPLLHADEAALGSGRDVGDARIVLRGRDRPRHLVRDVEDGQSGQRRGHRVRNLDRGHEATSFGSRKWTSSRATVTSSCWW